MIKILVIDDPKMDGVSYWRNVEPFAALRRQYPDKIHIQNCQEKNVSIQETKQFDIVVMFRPTTAESLQFVKNCKALGCRVILDIDDDLWSLPYYHPMAMNYDKYKDTARQIYDLADTVWTSTDQLRYVLGDLGRAEVMPNAVHPDWLPEAPNQYNGIAAWIGSVGTAYDATGPAEKWFEAWQEEYRRWLFFGYRPEMASASNCFGVPYGMVYEFMDIIKNCGANLIWKPLRDLPFNRAKSNIAWLTAIMSGAVCVTNFAGQPGWEYALQEFTTNPEEIAENWRQSRDCILQNYNLLTVNEARMRSIEAVVYGEKGVMA